MNNAYWLEKACISQIFKINFVLANDTSTEPIVIAHLHSVVEDLTCGSKMK